MTAAPDEKSRRTFIRGLSVCSGVCSGSGRSVSGESDRETGLGVASGKWDGAVGGFRQVRLGSGRLPAKQRLRIGTRPRVAGTNETETREPGVKEPES